MNNFLRQPLSFSWLESALEAWISFEVTDARIATCRSFAREIVTICKLQRKRVEKAEELLDRYRDMIKPKARQEIFRLMAEALMYIETNGQRLKVTDDPKRFFRDFRR